MAAVVAVPVVIAVEEVLVWAAAALGVTLAAWKAGEASDSATSSVAVPASSTSSTGGCPPHRPYDGKDLNFVAKSLGLTRKQLGAAIHREKRALEGNSDVQFCLNCGAVFTKTGEHVGDLL